MAERAQYPQLGPRAGRRAALLLAAVLVALLVGLAFAATAQATIRVKNISGGDTYGWQRGVAADVDAGYFQGVPNGYTPAMAVRMNNSWGSNRYLELKMSFTSRSYGPYRLVYLALTKDGTTLFNYAISDPMPEDYEDPPLSLHHMEIFETYETPTDGYWDAYFDHVCLTLPSLGPVKWYLHDHGTTSETKVVCPSYPQGEWARFAGITILDRYWNWVPQTAAWPVQVVDDNTYFSLYWDTPNLAWRSAPSSAADNDGSWEVGTWGQRGPAGISPYLDNGFRSQFSGAWTKYVYDTYPNVEPGVVKERDLREAGFDPLEFPHLPGTAATGFDKPDFSLFAAHGNTSVLEFSPKWLNEIPLQYEDDIFFYQKYARWGKTDLEWAYIFACLFTGWDPGDTNLWDYKAMAGAHAVCGFCTSFGCPNPDENNPPNGDDYAYGRDLMKYMTGQQGDAVNHTIVQAFELTAARWEGSGFTTRCFFTPTTLYDHLPGYGSFAITDPVGWTMGGPTYYRDRNT
jgi:hypothetical protein